MQPLVHRLTAGASISRQVAAFVVALAAGLAVAWIDSRPGWNDTGITAGTLLAAAFVASLIAGRRPWIWALLVGIWTPLVEIQSTGQPASIAALAFAAVGATIGRLVSDSIH